jgi:hypothetical protein
LEERQSEQVQFLLLNNHQAREVNNLIQIPLKKTPAPIMRCLPNLLISNVRSIASKIDGLSVVVSINQIDIVCITETWLFSI